MIVERNERLRKGLASMVEDLATDVYECADIALALSSYIEHRPDWVLMGLGTVESGGVDATRRITAAYPSARIVVVGDYDSDALSDEARSAGAVAYLLTENMFDVRAILGPPPSDDLSATET